MQFCPPSRAARCIENRCGTIARCKGNDAKRSETERRRGGGGGRDCNRNRSLALICHFARMATTAMESSKRGERRGSCLESGHTTSSGSHTHTHPYTHTHAYSRKKLLFFLTRCKKLQFFYKNFQFFSSVFFASFYSFFFCFLFLCLTPAAFLASISVAATHTHTHSLTLKSAEKTKNYKEEAEAAEEGSKRGEKKAMQKLSQNFYGDAATRQARRGAQGQRGGARGGQTLVAHVAGGDTCHRLLHAACCGGSHFICLLIKSCDTYKCPSGVNTFACMSSASQPPFPPASSLSSLPLPSPSPLIRTACSTNECQERVKICA